MSDAGVLLFLLANDVDILPGCLGSGARGLGYNMLQGFCDAGAAGAAIIDVLQEDGDAAVKALKSDFGVRASFYKVVCRS